MSEDHLVIIVFFVCLSGAFALGVWAGFAMTVRGIIIP